MPVTNCGIYSDIDGTLLSDKENHEKSMERASGKKQLKTAIKKIDCSQEEKNKMLELTKEVNYPLLEEYRKNSEEINLFTDMIFLRSSLEERKALIFLLELLGFKVPKVITPVDLFWPHLFPDPEATDNPEEVLSDMIIVKKYNHNNPQPFLDAVKNKYRAAYDLLMSIIEQDTQQETLEELFSCAEPGSAYKEAIVNNDYSAISFRSQIAKALLEILTKELGYKHAKALMLKHVLFHSEATEHHVFDDDSGVREGINQIIEEIAPGNNKTVSYSHIKIEKKPEPEVIPNAKKNVTPSTSKGDTELKKLSRQLSRLPKSKSLTSSSGPLGKIAKKASRIADKTSTTTSRIGRFIGLFSSNSASAPATHSVSPSGSVSAPVTPSVSRSSSPTAFLKEKGKGEELSEDNSPDIRPTGRK